MNTFTLSPRKRGTLQTCLLLLVLSVPAALLAATVNVSSLSALQTAINNAAPGDIIILANGTYTASADITISKQGTASKPITIQAQTIGGAEITGTNGFNIVSPAAYIIIKGFKFTHSASQATMASGCPLWKDSIPSASQPVPSLLRARNSTSIRQPAASRSMRMRW